MTAITLKLYERLITSFVILSRQLGCEIEWITYLSQFLEWKLLRAYLEEMVTQSHETGVFAAILLTC